MDSAAAGAAVDSAAAGAAIDSAAAGAAVDSAAAGAAALAGEKEAKLPLVHPLSHTKFG